MMSDRVVDELACLQEETTEFLQKLNHVQQNLLNLQEPKRQALVRHEMLQAEQLDQQELHWQKQLQTMLRQRSQLLQRFHEAGCAGQTLREVCRQLSWDQNSRLKTAFREAQRLTEELRQASWGLWVFTHRASRYYTQMLELIAQGGQQAPCYSSSEGESLRDSGGSLLDASI